MAQPVFDGHPLEEYFKDSGEASELMPGGLADILLQPYITGCPPVSKYAERMEKLCFFILGVVEALCSFFSSDTMSLRTQAFAERFKYGVISSSLLSPAFPVTPMVEPHRRGLTSLPGMLGHSRTPSAADSTLTDNLSLSMPPEPETPVWPLTVAFTVGIAALSARFYFLALLLLAATLYYMHVHRLDIQSKPDVMTPSLVALQHLIAAGQLWDTVINDTFTMLENEEQSIFYGPKSPRASSPSLRVSLSTSLLTTHTQCDNVRQLLSAITAPTELAQLSEMYAPPSPIKTTFAFSGDSHRPLSHPGSPLRVALSTDRSRKRSTWNGSYTSLALAGSPPAFQLAQRREKRRSDLSVLVRNTSPTPPRTRNALSSPPQCLANVSEEEEMVTAASSVMEDEEESSFGAAALGLYRNRVREGLRALELSHRTPLSPTRSSKPRTTMSPGSRYTSMHTTRHPLSLSSLRQSLQNALASKRFACAHLLALRFEDDEDEVYWEDVRSVMGLLTSTLVDASSRLSEVLDDVEEEQLKADDTASESASGLHTPSSPASPPPARTHLPLEHVVSFAPTASHLSRFASHVDAISSALTDAREHLEQSVASLKEDRPIHSPGHSSHPSSSSGDVVAGGDPSVHPALRAYEGLRRELGLALRECERGRERLVCIVAPPTPSTTEETGDDPDRGVRGEDVGADADVGADVGVGVGVVHAPPSNADVSVVVSSGEPDDPNPNPNPDPDPEDVPTQGIEQVFEGHSSAPVFTRPKSTLSRADRIRAKRCGSRPDPNPNPDPNPDPDPDQPRPLLPSTTTTTTTTHGQGHGHGHGWGPSGDVVQELRDVIWKVGERRRKRAEGVGTT